MNEGLLSLVAAESDEERRILGGEELDRRIYTAGAEFVIGGARLRGGRGALGVRTHTRYVDFPRHRHDYVEMMIMLSGSITHDLDGESVTLGEGEILILNKHIYHSVRRAERADVGVNVIISDELATSLAHELGGTVFAALFRENCREGGAPMYLHLSTRGSKSLDNLVENLLIELTAEMPDARIMERTVALLLACLSRDGSHLIGGSVSRAPETKRTHEIISYIKNNYRTASLGELCGRLYLTVPYLSRLIRERFGKSFKELVVDARMERASELILNTGMPIGDIIRAVGYENESYFHRVFRERFGTTPLAMRRGGEAGGVGN